MPSKGSRFLQPKPLQTNALKPVGSLCIKNFFITTLKPYVKFLLNASVYFYVHFWNFWCMNGHFFKKTWEFFGFLSFLPSVRSFLGNSKCLSKKIGFYRLWIKKNR